MRLNLLPGPLDVKDEIRRCFYEMPISHRSNQFQSDFLEVSKSLCEFVNAKQVQLLSGSGTLANDVVAGQLSLLNTPGIILSNGEFGDRLIDHGKRFGLSYKCFTTEPKKPFNYNELASSVGSDPGIDWLWTVHCETSTGMMHDLEKLKAICQASNIKLCLDCVSSIGNAKLNLESVYLASGSSGKGLGSYPGCSFVFFQESVINQSKPLPRYLDLDYYQSHNQVPFTFYSGHLYALKTILDGFDLESKLVATQDLSSWIRQHLIEIGLYPVLREELSMPAVITIQVGPLQDSVSIGNRLSENQILLSYESAYLVNENWIQICLMGDQTKEQIAPLFENLKSACLNLSPAN